MRLLHETLGQNEDSTAFYTTARGETHVKVIGTFNSGTLTMEMALPDGSGSASTYEEFPADGTDVTYTDEGVWKYQLPPGLYFRFSMSNTASVDLDIYISGPCRIIS